MSSARSLMTRKGKITFPAYIPVTTFGKKYPLDNLIRPYLPRLAPAIMVSFHYAPEIEQTLSIPLLLDSGGFASLFASAQIRQCDGIGILEYKNGEQTEIIHPKDVLDRQEKIADVAFTLDFPIPPDMQKEEAQRRLDLTIANAIWALENRRRKDLPLYACIQSWDAKSAKKCASAYQNYAFDGIAIGGLVPRARDEKLVKEIVTAVRAEIPDKPLHVFGLGKPEIVEELYKMGVDSVDSSSYVKLAASGQLWSNPNYQLAEASATDRLHLALCNLATATRCTLPLSAGRMLFGVYQKS